VLLFQPNYQRSNMARKKQQAGKILANEYLEGLKAAMNTDTDYGYNPYLKDRPHSEDFQKAESWRSGFADGLAKKSKRKKRNGKANTRSC